MASPLAAASAYANIARLAADPTRALANAAGAGPPPGAARGALRPCSRTRSARLSRPAASPTRRRKPWSTENPTWSTWSPRWRETEVAVDAMVAVRDKVIAAYEEIMKMPI